MKLKDPNPLTVLNMRRVSFCPPHFETVTLKKHYNMEQAICSWIESKLTGRYFFGNNVELDSDNNITVGYTIGFETAKELSYFTLACPYLKYN